MATLQEFLAVLEFKVDQAGKNAFLGTLSLTKKSVVGLSHSMVSLSRTMIGLSRIADQTISMGAFNTMRNSALMVSASMTGVVASIAQVTNKYENLYYASQRIGSGVGNIQAFTYGISQIGGSAAQAQTSLENMGRFIRIYGQGANGFFRSLGVDIHDAQGNLKDTTNILQELAPRWRSMIGSGRYAQAMGEAQILGIDENTLQAITRGVGQYSAELQQLYKMAGMNADQASEKSAQFMQLLRSLGQVFIVLKDKIALDLTKNVGQDIARFKALIVYHFNDISHVITEFMKFAIQIADVFIQLLGNVVDFGKETYNQFINLDEGTKAWIKELLAVVAAWKLINLTIMASPIGVVLMLIAAIALLIDDYMVWKKGGKSLIDWGQWKSEINMAQNGLKAFGTFLKDNVWKVIKDDVSDLLSSFKHFWPNLKLWMGPVMDFFGKEFISVLHNALGTLTGIVRLIDDLMNHDFNAAANDVGFIAGHLWALPRDAVVNSIQGMSEEVSTFVYKKGKEKKELAKGTLLARTALRDEDVPLVQAAALLGNFQQEGSMNPYTVSDPDQHGDIHYGIFQWTPDRAEKIKAALGIDVMHPDKDRNKALVDQVRATVWEMRHGQEKNTSRDFWNATNVISASDALNEKVLRSGEIVKGKIVDPKHNDLRRGYAQQALHYDLNPTSEWDQKTEDRWEKEAEENYFKAQGIDQKKFDEMNQKAAQARIAGRQLSIDQSQTSGDTNMQTNEITLYYNGSGSAQDAKAFAKQLNDSLNQQTNMRNLIPRKY